MHTNYSIMILIHLWSMETIRDIIFLSIDILIDRHPHIPEFFPLLLFFHSNSRKFLESSETIKFNSGISLDRSNIEFIYEGPYE